MLRDGLMTCPRQATRAVHILMLAMVFEHRLDHAGGRPFGRQLRVRLWEGARYAARAPDCKTTSRLW